VDGELGQVLAGLCPGRRDAGERIVVNPFGMALEDVALAASVVGVARERGVGTRIPR
jgi:ornithine cyclodeaminase